MLIITVPSWLTHLIIHLCTQVVQVFCFVCFFWGGVVVVCLFVALIYSRQCFLILNITVTEKDENFDIGISMF